MRAACALLAVGLGAAAPALADSHAVTVQNGARETIRRIEISAAPGPSENRLRSQLPPGAVARIGYSTGCQAYVRLVFDSGRTEEHPGIDACADARVVAGQDGVAAPPSAPMPPLSRKPTAIKAPVPATGNALPVKAPAPVVPPWTGKSIIKRFGGME